MGWWVVRCLIVYTFAALGKHLKKIRVDATLNSYKPMYTM